MCRRDRFQSSQRTAGPSNSVSSPHQHSVRPIEGFQQIGLHQILPLNARQRGTLALLAVFYVRVLFLCVSSAPPPARYGDALIDPTKISDLIPGQAARGSRVLARKPNLDVMIVSRHS